MMTTIKQKVENMLEGLISQHAKVLVEMGRLQDKLEGIEDDITAAEEILTDLENGDT